MGSRWHVRAGGCMASDSLHMQMLLRARTQTRRCCPLRTSYETTTSSISSPRRLLQSDRRSLHGQRDWLKTSRLRPPCRRFANPAQAHLHSASAATTRCSSSSFSGSGSGNSTRNLLPLGAENLLASSGCQSPTHPAISFTAASASASSASASLLGLPGSRAHTAGSFINNNTQRQTQKRRFATAPPAMVAAKLDGTAIAKGIREKLGQDIAEKQKLNPRFKPSLKIIQGTSHSGNARRQQLKTHMLTCGAFLAVGDRSDSSEYLPRPRLELLPR